MPNIGGAENGARFTHPPQRLHDARSPDEATPGRSGSRTARIRQATDVSRSGDAPTANEPHSPCAYSEYLGALHPTVYLLVLDHVLPVSCIVFSTHLLICVMMTSAEADNSHISQLT